MNSRSTKIFAIFFLTAVCVFLWSLWKRIIHIDDVWLGEYSYFFNQLGYVKSEAMRGFYGAENKLYVYHKLFTIEGAWVVQWFGFKPYALKSLSLLYLCLSFIPLNLIYKKYSDSRQSTLLLLALYISFFHTMNLGFTFRPEMHLVLWSLLIFLFLDKYIEKSKFEDLALAGFFAGVSIATHLNGNTLALTGVLFLWFFRRWWAGFIFGAIGSWGLFFYFFFDARSIEELKLSYLQLTQWRDVATGKYGWELFLRIFEEQGRYLHSPPEIIYSLMLVLLLIPARKYLKATSKNILIYLFILCFCVAEMTHGVNTNYLMYACPFFMILSVLSFEHLRVSKKEKLAWSAVAIFLVGSLSYDISEFRHREPIAPEYAKVAEFLPAEVQVLAPAHLMFSGLGKFHIQSFVVYRDMVEAGQLQPTPNELFTEAEKFQIDYIVVDESNKQYWKITSDEYGSYKKMSEQPSKSFEIFKRR